MLWWLTWIFAASREWNRSTKDYLINKSGPIYDNVYKGGLSYDEHCGPERNFEDLEIDSAEEQDEVRVACAQAATVWFMVWMCPFIVCGANCLVSVFCAVSRSVDFAGKRALRIIKAVVYGLALMFMGMYF